MFRTNPNLRSIAVLISIVAVCLVGAGFLRVYLCRPVPTGGKPPRVTLAWSIPTAGVRQIAFSSSGDCISTISKDGEVICYDSTGTKLYSTIVPGADRAIACSDGDYALAYSHKDPANTTLTFLDSAGRVRWTMDVSGAVWSADVGPCDSGACFIVGTGNRYVYAVTIGERSKRYRRWRAPGAVCSVSVDPESESVTYGVWQSSAICRTDLRGHRQWQTEADDASLHYLQPLGGSENMLVRSVPNRSASQAEAGLLETDGTLLSFCPIEASKSARALPSPDGVFVCVGYSKSIQHSDSSVPERHAALYDYTGRKLWDKGSMLMQITPILVARGGYVLADSGENTLFVINPSGELKQAGKLPAAMLSSTTSRDGSRALVTCADGRTYLLRISQ